MGSIARRLLECFATGLFLAAGQKIGEYLVQRLTSPRQQDGSGAPGTASRELCNQCGRTMRRVSRTLYCTNCGYREGC
jgi:hypothetical protein